MRDWWVKFKVSDSQNSVWQRRGVCYQFYSRFYGLQEQINVTEVKTLIWMCKNWLKVIENKNAKSLNYWPCTLVQEVVNISRVDDISFGRFTILSAGKTFLVEKNGEGALVFAFFTRATLFEGNKILLFAWDVIYFKLIYWCHIPRNSGHLHIVSKSLKIWIQFPNL